MRGTLLHYNQETEQGLLRAEDGRRYAFYGKEWRSEGRPVVGDEIDFEVSGSIAQDIYVLKPAGPQVDPARPGDTAAQATRAAGGGGVGQRLIASWTIIIALVTLIGCFLPLVSFGAQQTSVIGVGSEISRVVDTLSQLESMGRMLGTGAFGRQQRPQAQADLSGARWSLRIGYLLYLIPLGAFAVILLGLLQRPTARPALWNGLSALVLPIAVPLLVIVAIFVQLPADLRQMISQSGVSPTEFNILGLGFWVLVLSGVAQLANRFGFLRKQPHELLARAGDR